MTEMLIGCLKIRFDFCSFKLAKDQTLRNSVVCVATEKLGDPPTLRRAWSDRHVLLALVPVLISRSLTTQETKKAASEEISSSEMTNRSLEHLKSTYFTRAQ
jgi:hypothetical protein